MYKIIENRKNQKCTAWPQSDPNHLMVKRTQYTVIYPEDQILVHFTLWRAVFEIQGCRKSENLEMHRLTLDWPWILNGQKYLIYIVFTLRRPKLCLFRYKTSLFRNKRWLKIGNIGNVPITWDLLWSLDSHKYHIHVYTKSVPQMPKCECVFLSGQPFLRNKVDENQKYRKCIEWPYLELALLHT